MADRGDGIEFDAAVALRIGGGDDHPADPFDRQEPGQFGDGQPTLGLLAARHGHRVVVQELVGDVDPGGHGGPHGQRP